MAAPVTSVSGQADEAWTGSDWIRKDRQARRGEAVYDMAGLGEARPVEASCGEADKAGLGAARFGVVGRGRLGRARRR